MTVSHEDWIANVKPANGFLRAGSVRIYRSVEGTGIAPGIDAYPHAGLDINTSSYDYPWLVSARGRAAVTRDGWGPSIPAGNLKNPGMTPLGTSVAILAREGHDMLSSDCGYCSANLAKCKCGQGSENV